MDARRIFGNNGEDLGTKYLKNLGYEILERNFLTKYGEIDIIAKYKNSIRFVEVKSRKDIENVGILELVSRAKQRRIQNTATVWLNSKKINLFECDFGFDYLGIVYHENSDPVVTFVRDFLSR